MPGMENLKCYIVEFLKTDLYDNMYYASILVKHVSIL